MCQACAKALLALLALSGTACVPLDEQDALRVQAQQEWQRVTTQDGPRSWLTLGEGTWLPTVAQQTEQGVELSCLAPGGQLRVTTQNGVNDAVAYHQCAPVATVTQTMPGFLNAWRPTAAIPPAPTPPPAPWPPALMGQRLAPRS